MASLEPNNGNNQASFSSPSTVDHYPSSEFGGDHLSKLEPEVGPQPWQNPGAHFNKTSKASFMYGDGARSLPTFGAMDPNHQLVDAEELDGLGWENKLSYMLHPALQSSVAQQTIPPAPIETSSFLMGSSSPPFSEMMKWGANCGDLIGRMSPMLAVSNSTPQNLANFSTDPAFVERAAKFSSFNCLELATPYPLISDGGKFPQRSSTAAQELHNGDHIPEDIGEAAQRRCGQRCVSLNESDESMCQEASSSCERNGAYEGASQGVQDTHPGKKRRTAKNKSSKMDLCNTENVKDMDTDDAKARHRQIGDDQADEGSKPKIEPSQSGNSDNSTPKSTKESSKPPEAPKPDYIHVRARRGQATDSHSLAERVRREKISERMKFLQELVPGCSKVTGKALMLDEIINYVQSLQRQVEFLSMKLAAVNPRPDFNIESLFARESRIPSMVFAPENTSPFPSLLQQPPPQTALQDIGTCAHSNFHAVGRDPMLRAPLVSSDVYADSVSQMVQAWDNELQSVVQMGIVQGRQTPLSSPGPQGNPGQLFLGQMKVEL